jgi:hypothetical protein
MAYVDQNQSETGQNCGACYKRKVGYRFFLKHLVDQSFLFVLVFGNNNSDRHEHVAREANQAYNVINDVELLCFVVVHSGILAYADVEVDRVLARQDGERKLGPQAEQVDPDAEEEAPELVVKRGRIFQPENARVPGYDQGRQDEQNLGEESRPDDDEQPAHGTGKRSQDEAHPLWNGDQNDDLDACPAHQGKHLVDDRALAVQAVPLVPNDAVTE